ncbi:PAS domain-containing protein [Rhizorhabdus argentea]|uniref:PAS domain-containing protein n=1 Tax=Rhizorhabdus argentea TaxID=1387174 RepID=UPI0030EE3590
MHDDGNANSDIDIGMLVDALPGLVWTTQADGRCDFVNRIWREYTGLALDEAVDHGWKTAIHPDDLTSFMESWELIKETGEVRELDGRLRRFDGEYRWLTLRPSPFREGAGTQQRWCWLALVADETPMEPDARLCRFMDMLPIQVGFVSPAGVTEFSNRQALADYDMTLEELQQWTTSGAIHPDDQATVYDAVERLLKKGKDYDLHHRMLQKGEYRWLRAMAAPCRDAHGNVVRYVSLQLDVDDLKHAENLLAAEVKLLEMVARDKPLPQILDTISRVIEDLCGNCFCSILTVGPDRNYFQVGAGSSMPAGYSDLLDGRFIDQNDNPYSLAITDKTPVISADLVHDSRWAGSAWSHLMKSIGFASCWAMPITSSSGEASGTFAIYRHQPVGPTSRDQELVDRFTKIAGIAIDRVQADAALLASEGELRAALAQLSQGERLSKTGSFTADIQLDQHHWSDEFYRIFEINPTTRPKAQAVRDRVHADDLEFFDTEFRRGMEGLDSDFTFRIVTPGAGVKHLRRVARLMGYDAGRPKIMGAVQDITANKLAEEALNQVRSELAHVARVATLNAMTASIAHEVSQPLSGILTNASTGLRMLAADPPNLAGVAETAKRTIRDANRATEVIKRLRAMFAKSAPTKDMIDLNDTARELIALSSGELQRGRVVLHTYLAEDLPHVVGDRVQLQQVILNLLLNAADAMAGIEDRSKALQVRTELLDDGNVQLIVQDSGVGLDEAALERLFDPFYTTKAHGMGVGLSISRSIVESHEGQLWATNNEGAGATFGFRLPRAAKDASTIGGERPT